MVHDVAAKFVAVSAYFLWLLLVLPGTCLALFFYEVGEAARQRGWLELFRLLYEQLTQVTTFGLWLFLLTAAALLGFAFNRHTRVFGLLMILMIGFYSTAYAWHVAGVPETPVTFAFWILSLTGIIGSALQVFLDLKRWPV